MKRKLLSWILVMIFSWIPLLHAEDSAAPPTEVQSPFQGEFVYPPGQVIELNLLIDGVHWSTFKLDGGDPADLKPGKTTKVEVVNTLENTASRTRVLSIVILLEDSTGNLLERLSLGEVKLSKGRYRSDRQKFKLRNDTLIDLAKIYIFAEIK